jgi:hypothetical protein
MNTCEADPEANLTAAISLLARIAIARASPTFAGSGAEAADASG